MMRTIHLYGALADRFGTGFSLDVASVAEAVRALQANFRGFHNAIRGGAYQILHGDTLDSGVALTQPELGIMLGPGPLHFLPVAEGSEVSTKGIITVIVGVILIAASIYTAGSSGAAGASLLASMGSTTVGGVTMTQVAMLGATLTLGGIAQLAASAPNISSYDNRDEKHTSYLFSGNLNRHEQGVTSPVLFGRWRVSPIMVSGAIGLSEDDSDLYPGMIRITTEVVPPKSIQGYTSLSTIPPDGGDPDDTKKIMKGIFVRKGKNIQIYYNPVEPYVIDSLKKDDVEQLDPEEKVLPTYRLDLTNVQEPVLVEIHCVEDQDMWDALPPEDFTD